jgi:hypothetical protein
VFFERNTFFDDVIERLIREGWAGFGAHGIIDLRTGRDARNCQQQNTHPTGHDFHD